MEATQTTDKQQQAASSVEAVFLENTLLRVFGVLFCHDAKRARSNTGTIEINKGVKERGIAVRFDPEYAQPGPLAHRITLAVIRKQSRYGRPARNTISFSQRELGRLIGRSSFGGRDSDELALALKQIQYSHVLAHFKQGERYLERDFSVFNEVVLERRSSPHDPIVACTVVLAEPIIASLIDNHFTCLNHAVLEQLGTIGQAMFMRLFFHFATHYDGHHRSRVQFKKRYDDICREWLGGLIVLSYRSKIIREQLGRHLDQLASVGFLSGYSLEPAADGKGFVFTFRPGLTFFDDYQRFYARRAGSSVVVDFKDDRETIGEPHRVAHLFAERRTDQQPAGVPYVSTKDVETAKEILSRVPFAQVPDFLDYAFARASRTNFDMQTLGAVKQYLNDYLRDRKSRDASRARSDAARAGAEKQLTAKDAYNRFYRTEAAKLFQSLPAEERGAIEALARSRTPSYASTPGTMAEPFFLHNRDRITAQRYPGSIPSFDEWRMGGQTGPQR
jgi:hypothetical protein